MITWDKAEKIFEKTFPDKTIYCACEMSDRFCIVAVPTGEDPHHFCGGSYAVWKKNGKAEEAMYPLIDPDPKVRADYKRARCIIAAN